MADEVLRQFYMQVGQLVGPCNEMRLALIAGDDLLAKQQAECFLTLSSQIEVLVNEYLAYTKQIREWGFSVAVWAHGGSSDPKPPEPTAPARMPDNRDASGAIDELIHIRKVASEYLQGKFHAESAAGLVDMMLWDVIRHLKNIQQSLIGDARSKPVENDDGPIDRNQLAKLLCVANKTLKNRSAELPEPIGKGEKDVPIYKYSEAKAAAAVMFPNRVGFLPLYKEAITRKS